MGDTVKISGERIFLKPLSWQEVTPTYVEWMQDKEITRFLESRWKTHTLESIKSYIEAISEAPDAFLFGIFENGSGEHIGNIKIDNINQTHKFGHLGLIIGNKKVWGRGYGAEAIKLATRYAFEELYLNKLVAGIYANNIGSYKAFIKAGFQDAGRLKNNRLYENGYVDEILVELCNDRQMK